MSYNLFLDDFRSLEDAFYYMNDPIYLKEKWDIVRNYDEFVELIQNAGIPDKISFDHDLADTHYNFQREIDYDVFKEKTGYDCAKWLINYCMDKKINLPRVVFIHSMNRVGSENIKSLFDTYYKVYSKKI